MDNNSLTTWSNFYSTTSNLKNFLEDIFFHASFLKEIIRIKPQRVLEVGIGKGTLSIIFGLLGYNVVGVDNDLTLVTEATKRIQGTKVSQRVNFLHGDAFKLSKIFAREEKFDCCFSQGLMEHFSDGQIRDLLKEQLAIAQTVIFSVPSIFFPFHDFGNERLLSAQDWKKILNGFNVAWIKYYGRLLSFDVGLRFMLQNRRLSFKYINKFTNLVIKVTN